MTTDYPDFTRLTRIVGTNIQVPVDIQSTYVQIPVDIQAQYVDLDIKIVAQDVTIEMDIHAQTVAVNLQADWSAIHGEDKNVYGILGLTSGTSGSVGYTVTAGKTLYITDVGVAVYAQSEADRDKPQICKLTMYNATTTATEAVLGGNGGCSKGFVKPISVGEGEQMQAHVLNGSGHDIHVAVSFHGYEV